ncbi:hypothetical protein VNO77_36515 [Canavalia gladiata]|uniref:Uncharacterized protein n=1 Tax=Canavalia gladiata TaxID=3824 RepID=A0AAN9K822_CANGL
MISRDLIKVVNLRLQHAMLFPYNFVNGFYMLFLMRFDCVKEPHSFRPLFFSLLKYHPLSTQPFNPLPLWHTLYNN